MSRLRDFQFGVSRPRGQGDDHDRRRPLRRAGRLARESTVGSRYNRALAEHTRSRSALQAASMKATEYAAQREADRDLQREEAEMRLEGTQATADSRAQQQEKEVDWMGAVKLYASEVIKYRSAVASGKRAGKDTSGLEAGLSQSEKKLAYAEGKAGVTEPTAPTDTSLPEMTPSDPTGAFGQIAGESARLNEQLIANEPAAQPQPTMQSAGAPEGSTATHPTTGQKIVLRNGQWEPL